jgi:hypothetical protein
VSYSGRGTVWFTQTPPLPDKDVELHVAVATPLR